MHKSKLAALDRKITAELTPKQDENDVTENKQEQSRQSQPVVKAETKINTVNVHIPSLRMGINPRWWLNP